MFKAWVNVFLIFCMIAGGVKSAKAGSFDDFLRYSTCESSKLYDAIHGKETHTCIVEPLLDISVTALITVGGSLAAATRLKMNDDGLGDSEIANNCKRTNRATFDPGYPATDDAHQPGLRLRYAFCNNVKLLATFPIRAVSGDVSPDMFHDFYTRGPGSFSGGAADSNNWYVDLPAVYLYRVEMRQDRLCISIMSIAGLYVPIGCKYINEPYPRSIYDIDLTLNNSSTSGNDLSRCSSINDCSARAKEESRSIMTITSPIINCIREMIYRLLISTEVCNPLTGDATQDRALASAFEAGLDTGSVLHRFQTNMRRAVSAALTLYVMLFGFKLLLGGGKAAPKDFIMFALKIIFVAYFSIGINMQSGSVNYRYDGMAQYAFPILLNGITSIANWIFSNSPNGLCEFLDTDYAAGTNIGYLKLWDAIDCRLVYYIGLDGIMEQVIQASADNERVLDNLNHTIPPYVFLLIPAIITGSMTLVSMAIAYPIMVVSFAAYTVCLFVTGMITIMILGVMAPIFVPMLLFEYTKNYFFSWVRVLLSCMIQPAVAVSFLALMFSAYDLAFFGTCRYYSYTAKDAATTKSWKVFFIDEERGSYIDQEEYDNCHKSLGWILNNFTSSMTGIKATVNSGGEINVRDPAYAANIPATEEDYTSNPSRTGGVKITVKKGLFAQSPAASWQDFVDIIKAMIISFIMLSVMKNLMDTVTGFAASITGGASLGGATPSAGQINAVLTKIVSSVAGKGMPKKGEAQDKMKGGKGGGLGKMLGNRLSSALKKPFSAPKGKNEQGGGEQEKEQKPDYSKSDNASFGDNQK